MIHCSIKFAINQHLNDRQYGEVVPALVMQILKDHAKRIWGRILKFVNNLEEAQVLGVILVLGKVLFNEGPCRKLANDVIDLQLVDDVSAS